MAKLLVSCDEYIYRVNGLFYAASESRKEFLTRYLRVFDKVRYVLRCIDEEQLKPGRALISSDRVEIIPVPIFHGPVQYAKKYFQVKRAVNGVTNECDAAILRLPSTVGQLISNDILLRGIPYAVEVVFDAHDGADTASNFIEKFLWRLIDGKMRSICEKADGVSCVTEHYLQQHYFSTKEGHFTSFYSSLTLDKSFFSAPRKYPTSNQLSVAHVDLQIDLFGRKGTSELIRAIRMLKNRGISIRVRFAGEDRGGRWDEIIRYARILGVEDNIEYVGFLNRDELGRFLEESDIFVLPTRAEGLPRVIIEAIAKGLPVVTTPVSGNPELVEKDFLVEYYDIQGLADTIEKLVINKGLYEETSQRNFNHSLQYESSILQARRDRFYEQLLSKVK